MRSSFLCNGLLPQLFKNDKKKFVFDNYDRGFFFSYFKKLILAVIFWGGANLSKGQDKPILDTSSLQDWTSVENGKISNDGKYVSYEVNHTRYGSLRRKELFVQTCDGRWKIKFNDATSYNMFSTDSKKFFALLPLDTLVIFDLVNNHKSFLTKVSSFRVVNKYLIVSFKEPDQRLQVINLITTKEFFFDNVIEFDYSEENQKLILVQGLGNDTSSLSEFNLKITQKSELWKGRHISGGLTFDHLGKYLAFLGEDNNGIRGVWVHRFDNSKNELIIDNKDIGIDSSFQIAGVYKFSDDNRQLLFYVQPYELASKRLNENVDAEVSIWSYLDPRLKSQDERGRKPIIQYYFAADIKEKRLVCLSQKNEKIISYNRENVLILHSSGGGDRQEADWNPNSQDTIFLVSLKDGSRRPIPTRNPIFSRAGKYLLYYNPSNRDYYTYEISSGKITNITKGISASNILHSRFYDNEFSPDLDYQSFWLKDDLAVIIHAQRDLWLVDPTGKSVPVNLTNGFGAAHNVFFSPIEDLSSLEFNIGECLTLMGFNFSTKDNGFYKISWGRVKDPIKITMNDYVYYTSYIAVENGLDNRPIKAEKSSNWLIKRMNEHESPNYFVTKDFKTFLPISNCNPEKKYNWLTTELYNWKSYSGDTLQGILYKPENFDPHRKYPIVFHYYEGFSNNLHAYLSPNIFDGPINVPYLVSRGYLVFIPDIKYETGRTGRSAYNSVVSIAELIAKKTFVDSTKMAIQGHSFGGYETNYIITHTNIFAAASSASGITDLFSFAGGLAASGRSMHWAVSKGQIRLNKKLWEDIQMYIENSPLFYLQNVGTPLLLMHTTNDISVPFSQALELFNGLRLFRKKVWLLVYSGENHILSEEHNAIDFTNRQIQFFDYYLKDKEEPVWMK